MNTCNAISGLFRRATGRIPALLAGATLLFLAACDSAEDRKQSHYDRGLELAAEEPGKAILEFTNAIRIDEGFVPAHRELARLHREGGRLPQAAGHYEIVAEKLPEDVDSRVALAEIYLELRAVDRAMAAADAVLALAPQNAPALGVRASIDLLLDDPETAVRRARAALEADPNSSLARLVLVAERLRADAPREALALLDQAPEAQTQADRLGLGLVRIQVLERLDDREAVGETLRRLVQLDPENEGLRLALARWHMQGDPADAEAAEAELRAIAEMKPEDPAPRLRVVDFLRETQGEAAARAELERLAAEASDPLYERALAVAEAQAGDRAAAVARMEAAAAREEGTEVGDAARLLLARLLEGPEAETRRAALIEEVLVRDPSNAEALAMRADAAIRDDRPDDAVTDLRAALDQEPRSPVLLELLAVAHERAGDDALAAERRALAVQASDAAPGPTLRYAGQLIRDDKLGTAESILLDALGRAPRNRELLGALADVRLRRQDWAGAREVSAALQALGPEDPVADQLLAATLFGEGRLEESIGLLEEGWQARGEAMDLEALVRAYAASGDLERAEDFLAQALADNPDDRRAVGLLAEVRAARGDGEGAETVLREAIMKTPDDPRLYELLSAFLLSRGRTEEADAALDAGLEAAPDDAELRFEKAMRLEVGGEVDQAIALYERLYDENPDSDVVANNLASLLSDHRDDAESVARAANVARRLRGSSNPAFQDTYGWTLHRAGESAQAAAILRESAPGLPENAIAQFHLGMAYAAIGQDDLAREQLNRALELADAGAFFPQRPQAEAELERLAAAKAAEDQQEGNG